ncbi:minor tail protein [Mycobacterium phage Suarez]|nr:minor tail protein [Mycobacterium phage Suarez]
MTITYSDWEPEPERLARLERTRQEILYGDPMTAADAAERLAEEESVISQEWVVSIHDKLWQRAGEFGEDVISLEGSDPRNGLPTSTLKVKGNCEFTDMLMSCKSTFVGLMIETGGIRMPFYVDSFDYEFEDGAWVGTAQLLGIYDILNYIVIWPTWWLPLAAQPFSHAIYIGGLCTCIEAMIMENSLRLQSGIWEFINNVVSLNPDMRAWIGTLLQSNGNIFDMLKTPIYVVRTNPLLDTSPLVARTVRMETCGAVIDDITRAYGVTVSVDLWLPGDEQPDYWTKNFASMRLTQPTYVVTVKDRSRITGPTGTVIDSAVRQVVDVAGSFFGDLLPIIQKVPGRDGVYISEQLGVDYVGPWALLIAPEPGEKGNVVTCRISFHTPKGWQHIIGGRSPKWLNDLMNATFSWMIDALSILIGFTGIPSNLLEGFMNNTLLAFQLVQNYARRNEVGPYHPGIEVFHATASAPYNIETVFGFINAMWDSRGWVSAIVTFRNGEVYTLGKDVFKGGLISLLYMERTRIFTDYIEEIKFRLDATHRDILVQIGDGKAEESPLAKHQRFMTGILESINVALLTPQS